MRRSSIVTVVLCVLVLALASACGGSGGGNSESSTGTNTYSNDEYRFSVDYPASYVQTQPGASPFTQGMDYVTAFGDASGLEDAQQSGNYLKAVLVGAKQFPRELTKAEIKTALKETVKAVKGLPSDVPEAGYSDIEVLKCKLTKLNGTPCVAVEMTFTNNKDKRQRDVYYMMMSGDKYYFIQISVPEDEWLDSQAELSKIPDSFKSW